MIVATLAWTAPTRYTDGSPIRDKITYSIFSFGRDPAGAPLVTGVEETHYRIPRAQTDIHQCFYVKAVVGGTASAGSNIACIEPGVHR